jgi:hypothetical protein
MAAAMIVGGAVIAGATITSSTAAIAADTPGASPIENLGGCLAGGGVGDFVLLIDESESVQQTDPDDARVAAAQYFLSQLETFAGDSGTDLQVQVATFAQTYTPLTGWVGITDAGNDEVRSAIASVAERDGGWETDYWSALNGARAVLADAVAGRGGTSSCQAIVWFSDGELWFNPVLKGDARKGFAPDLVIEGQAAADEARRLAEADLCRDGGLADQLRSSKVVTFGIGLDGPDMPAGGFDLMEAIATGASASGSTSCGREVDPTPGAFFLASDIDSLLFAFDELGTPGQPPIQQERGICQVSVCTSEGHRVVLDDSTPLVTVLATSELAGAAVSVQSPSGAIVDIPTGSGSVDVDGAAISYVWESDRSVSLVIDGSASSSWSGLWQLAFTDPAGTSAGQTSKSNIRVQGTLLPAWGNAEDVALRAGDKTDGLAIGLRSRDGRPVDLGVIEGSLAYSAEFRDSAGDSVTIIRTSDPADLAEPQSLDLSDAALGAGIVTLRSQITTAATTFEGEEIAGTALEAETVTIPVTILPPLEYPVVGSSVDFGRSETATVQLNSVLPASGDGCVRVGGDVEVVAGPADIGDVRVAADQDGCISPSDAGIPLILTTDKPGNGTLNGTFVVTLEPDPQGEAITTTVTFTASLIRPIDAVNFWLTLVLAIILGPGIPLAILYALKWIISTIPARMLYGFVADVSVTESGALRDGQPFAIHASDTANLVSIPSNARRLSIGDVQLKVKTGWSPFGRGDVIVVAPGRTSISNGDPGTDRTRLRARLPLDIHNHWVLMRTPGEPADHARLMVLLGGNDAQTIERFEQTLADRAASRLAALVDAETDAGTPPVVQGPPDPFAAGSTASPWAAGSPFEGAAGSAAPWAQASATPQTSARSPVASGGWSAPVASGGDLQAAPDSASDSVQSPPPADGATSNAASDSNAGEQWRPWG